MTFFSRFSVLFGIRSQKKVTKCCLIFIILTEQTNIDTGHSKKTSRVHNSRIELAYEVFLCFCMRTLRFKQDMRLSHLKN